MEENSKKTKAIFIIRAVLWFLLAGILPFIFISWKFGMFEQKSGTQLTSWALFGVIVIAFTLLRLAKYVYKGMKPGIAKQCIHGAITVVAPLIIAYVLLEGISNNIAALKLSLGCVILCEACAIPIDPFPEWIAKKYEGKFENLFDVAFSRAIKKEKNENK